MHTGCQGARAGLLQSTLHWELSNILEGGLLPAGSTVAPTQHASVARNLWNLALQCRGTIGKASQHCCTVAAWASWLTKLPEFATVDTPASCTEGSCGLRRLPVPSPRGSDGTCSPVSATSTPSLASAVQVLLEGHTGWVRSLAIEGRWLFSCAPAPVQGFSF